MTRTKMLRTKKTSRRRPRFSPRVGFRDGSCVHTLSYRDKLTASSNVIAQLATGADFTGMGDFAFVFAYCQPMSYRIRVFPISTNDITSGYACFVPLNPQNYTVSHNLVDPERIGEVRGNVGLWNSMPIESAWIRWPFPNTGMESLFVRDNNLGYFLSYSADNATYDLSFEVQITFAFRRRQLFNTFLSKNAYTPTPSAVKLSREKRQEETIDEEPKLLNSFT